MVKAPADSDTLAPDERDLNESFWGRPERQSRANHPAARATAAPTQPRPSRSRSGRNERRRTRSKPRRGRTILMLLSVALVVGLAVGSGWWWRNRMQAAVATDRTPATSSVAAPAPPSVVVPVSAVAHRRADGRLDLVALAGSGPNGTAPAMVFVPTMTQLEVPAYGLQQVGELHRLGGAPLLELALENAFGVSVGTVAVVDDAALQGLFEAAGPILVTLRTPVTLADPELKLAAGSQTLTPEHALAVVTRTPSGTGELDHIDVVRAVFDAWVEAVRNPERASAAAAKVPAIAGLTKGSSGVRMDMVPVDQIGLGTDERYQVQTSEAATLMSRAFPEAQFRAGTRPRVEVRGDSDRAILDAGRCIVAAGGNIRLTGRAEPADNTSVMYYRDRAQDTARSLRDALGAGTVKQGDRDLGLVDVTVLVGKDFIGCQ